MLEPAHVPCSPNALPLRADESGGGSRCLVTGEVALVLCHVIGGDSFWTEDVVMGSVPDVVPADDGHVVYGALRGISSITDSSQLQMSSLAGIYARHHRHLGRHGWPEENVVSA